MASSDRVSAHRWLLAALGLGVLVVVAYAPAVSGPFFFDDEHFVQRNTYVHSLASIPRLFTTSVTEGAALAGNFYRPLQQVVYTLLWAVFGERTTLPYHLVSLALHLLSGLFLFRWLRLLDAGRPAAFAAVALFLLHPVQTEAVSYVSGLADPLALAWMLGGLVAWTGALRSVDERAGWRVLPIVLGCALGAVASKESGVVFVALVVLTALFAWRVDRRRPRPAELAAIAGTVVIAATYLVLRFTVLRFSTSAGLTEDHNAYTESLALRLTTFVNVLTDYARLLAWPLELNYEKPYRAYESLLTARGAFGVVVLVACAIALARGRRSPRAALGVAFTLAALAPFTGLVPLNAMYLEHWLYVPIVGLALLVATALDRFAAGRGTYGVLALVVALLAARTFTRNRDWGDVERFYLNELAHGGDSVRICNNLGMLYADRGDLTQAITFYRRAVDDPRGLPYPQPHHNLANLYAQTGQLRGALEELRAALRIQPGFTYSLDLLRRLFVAAGDQPRADLVARVLADVQAGRGYDAAAFDREVFAPLDAAPR